MRASLLAVVPVQVAVMACGDAEYVGLPFTTTVVDVVDEQPVVNVQVAEYVVVRTGETSNVDVRSPVDQTIDPPVQPVTAKVADCPVQIVGELIVMTGSGLIVTGVLATSEQPLAVVTVTEYTPLVATTIEATCAPVDQLYVLPPPAINVRLPPWQVVPLALLLVMRATGRGLIVTVAVAVAEQPAEVVAVTE